jgi:hypothetical protein
MVFEVKVLQIDCNASCWVCSKQSLGQFVSNLIENDLHACIDARLDVTSSIFFKVLASKRGVSKNPLKFVVLEVLILLDIEL